MPSDEVAEDPEGGENSQRLMIRSTVPPLEKYGDYRKYLRDDFFYSCGYCTLSEYEAQGLAFEIDHYEPVSERPELEHEYTNLIYSCDECNSYKSDLCPPPAARAQGYEIFRPDRHVWEDHFEPSGTRLAHRSNVGEFTSEVLNLNRQSLRRLRELRERLDVSAAFVASGVQALRQFRIDQLPPSVRAHANRAISENANAALKADETVDDLLKSAVRSTLLDEDAEKPQRMAERSRRLASVKAIFPGKWRGRENNKERQRKS